MLSRRRLALLATAAAMLLPGIAHAQAPTTIAFPPSASKVATYAGVTAYSVRGGDGLWRLTYDTNSNGRAQTVPVAPRSVPFDVDLGPSRTDFDEPVAVYSRCEQEPEIRRRSSGPLPAWTTARRCDLYRFDFRTQQEEVLDGPSTHNTEVLPTIWGDMVGFVRIYHSRGGLRGRVPYVYVREAGERSERQPGGGRGSTGLPGPTGLDLDGDLARADLPAQLFSAVRDRRSNLTIVGTAGQFFDVGLRRDMRHPAHRAPVVPDDRHRAATGPILRRCRLHAAERPRRVRHPHPRRELRDRPPARPRRRGSPAAVLAARLPLHGRAAQDRSSADHARHVHPR